jgi:anti-sigma regulatory factor (Ser/Thr protein kinase)
VEVIAAATHFVLPRSVEAAGQGRRLLAQALGGLPPSVLANALLVLTELVTNSVLHGPVPKDRGVDVEIRLDERRLTLSVCDPGPGLDPDIIPKPRDEGGWGLLLVDRLSSRWGVKVNDHTCVWADFDLL